ncbi:hypothetical protein GCM10007854_07870 [Algimonas porphyrae]|uniref:Uncharacterized protein n=1 Tax=Algimonas porphyrae TaxID=1128113 RepID=A0ABQ5UYP4_9PROT|nr:hypothetical protein GCM10007854_07870 [Algimonas porphyrae]
MARDVRAMIIRTVRDRLDWSGGERWACARKGGSVSEAQREPDRPCHSGRGRPRLMSSYYDRGDTKA